MRKIIVNENQFNILMNILDEGVGERVTVPTDLKNLLSDNPNTVYISFIKSDNTKVNFKLENNSGHLRIKNITDKAIYNNFSGEFRPSTMIYGSKAIVNYDSKLVLNKATNSYEQKDGNWRDTITNITMIQLFDNGGKSIDSMELDDTDMEPQVDLPVDDKVTKFNNEFKNLKSKQQFKLIARQTYDGMVLDRNNNTIEFELVTRGNKSNVINCLLDLTSNKDVFIKTSTDSINLETIRIKQTGNAPFTIQNIKNLVVSPAVKTKDELDQEKAEEERKRKEQAELDAAEAKRKEDEKSRMDSETRTKELEKDKKLGKEVYDIIMKDAVLKKAFFHQPKLFGMIKAGNPIGIVPAKKIVNKYLQKNTDKKIGENSKKFPVNSTITFEVVDKDLVIPEADNFTLPVGRTYKAIVRQREIGVNYIQLIHKKDDMDPEFFLNIYQQRDKDDIENDIYPANIKVEYLSSGQQRYTYPPSEMGRIKVTNYKFK